MPCYSDGNLTICTGSNTQYRARTRLHGYRQYKWEGKWSRSYKVALMRMATAFADHQNVKRADVLMVADYYDPVQLCELVRR